MFDALDQLDHGTGSRPVQCVWMTAGVVDYKLCDADFDCEHCPFDENMGSARRHAAPPAGECDRGRPDAAGVRGYRLPALFYHPRHAWARIEHGPAVRVGLDDFGQRLLGRIYSVALPPKGARLGRGDTCLRVTYRDGEADVVSPVSGIVREVNTLLPLYPSLLNRDPYGGGWALLLEPDDLEGCLRHLLYGASAAAWLRGEVDTLEARVAACEPGADERRRLVESFFRSSHAPAIRSRTPGALRTESEVTSWSRYS
jgi:glycine cleavage system H lipoate-binding protein